MLNITITGSSPATECDRCDAEYKKENGCSLPGGAQQLAAEGHGQVYAEDVI